MENNLNHEDETNKTSKKIFIEETKKINTQKEKKMRVETKTWGLCEDDLIHEKQLNILKRIQSEDVEKDVYTSKLITHIKAKICGYKQQDITKHKLNTELLVSFREVIQMLVTSEMKCCYCSDNVYVLYEKVRESKQWSLDRIDNDLGHNNGNLVISCLECNLKRRRTNKDAFMFTKNMVIVKGT